MLLSTLLFFILALTFTAAAPAFDIDWSTADDNAMNQNVVNGRAQPGHVANLVQHHENKAKVESAKDLANKRLDQMQGKVRNSPVNWSKANDNAMNSHVVNDKIQPGHVSNLAQHIEFQNNAKIESSKNGLANSKQRDNRDVLTGFGLQAKLPAIDENITRMKKGTMKINSASHDPRLTDGHAAAQGIPGPDGGHKIVNGRAQYSNVVLGPGFHGLSKEDQAGTLIHELSHVNAGTTDDVIEDPNEKSLIDQPNHGMKDAEMYKGAAYAEDDDGKLLLHKDIIAGVRDTDYWRTMSDVPNAHAAADPYRVLSSLCARSLYKRALTQEDPAGYYLAKRQQCSLPSASKSRALAKGGNSKAAQTSRGTPSEKASKGLNAKKGPKPTRAERRRQAKAAKTAKDLQGAKGGKGANGVRKARTNNRKPRGNGRKATKAANRRNSRKGANGSKAMRGSKTGKSGRVARKAGRAGRVARKGGRAGKRTRAANRRNSKKGANRSKAMRGSKAGKARRVARKSGKAGRVSRKAGRAGRVARKGAKSNRKSNRKSVAKGKGKGSKRGKGGQSKKGLNAKGGKAKGGKRSKAMKGSKAKGGKKGARGRKTGKGGKVAKKGGKAGKKGGKKGGKAVNSRKSRKSARKARSNKPKNGRAARNKKQNSRKAKGGKAANSRKSRKAANQTKSNKPKNRGAAKAKKQNSRQATKKNQGSKTSNRAGNRNNNNRAPKAAAKPKVQQRAAKAAPKKAGKKN